MARYIDAEEITRKILYFYHHTINGGGEHYAYAKALSQIDHTPTADVVEVKHGEWILHFDDLFPVESTKECSVCHEEEFITLCNENYCPNCGAKMDGGNVE